MGYGTVAPNSARCSGPCHRGQTRPLRGSRGAGRGRAGPDALKLVASGRVELGVLDIHDLAIARSRGTDLVAIGALVGRALAALIARPGITRPRDLERGTVGVSGLPRIPPSCARSSSTTARTIAACGR
jgi:NMT1/THI5 like protein